MPLRNGAMLFLCAFIWGTAFVAQSVGMDYMGPLTFSGLRFLLGAAVLLPLVAVRECARRKSGMQAGVQTAARSGNGAARSQTMAQADSEAVRAQAAARAASSAVRSQTTAPADNETAHPQTVPHSPALGAPYSLRRTVLSGIVLGFVLFCASTIQQIALQTADVGKAGFITAMYIVIVPVLSFLFTRRFFPRVWVCVAVALVGLYFLCVPDGAQAALTAADGLLLFSALLFAVHILCIARLGAAADGIALSFVQFLVAGAVGTVLALLFEHPQAAALTAGLAPLLYAGVLSSGVAFTLQIVGQKGVDPTIASLLMSLESVISVLAGWAVLGQTLTGRELFGCALMFAAIVAVQLPGKEKRKSAFSKE